MKFVLSVLFILPVTLFGQWSYVSSPNIFYPTNQVASYNGKLYAAGNNGVYESTDGGQTWTDLTQGFGSCPSCGNRFLAFSGSNIYVGTTTGGVFMSTDNGATWQTDTVGLQNGGQVNMLHVDGSSIFVALDWSVYGLFKKNVGSSVWTRISGTTLGQNAASRPLGMGRIGGELFIATYSAGLYKSTDDGNTWTQISGTGYPSDLGVVGWPAALLVHGTNLVLRSANGVHRSTNFGGTWSRIDQGFAQYCPIPNLCWTPILAFHTRGTNIYAGVQFVDSAYVSTDGGTTWQDISDGVLNTYLTSFTVHENVLYGTTWLTDSNRVVRYGGPTSAPEQIDNGIATEFMLHQNFPNPFNPSTVVRYVLPASGYTSLKVYNLLGQEVATLVNGDLESGTYETHWNAAGLPSGVYVYRVTNGTTSLSRTMLLLK
jgi:photosystem II stability/assembly factor-like uncharacterized protein